MWIPLENAVIITELRHWADIIYDKEIVEARTKCAELCYEFDQCRPSDTARQEES